MRILARKAAGLVEWMSLPGAAKAQHREDARGIPAHDPGAQRVIEEGIAWLGHAQDRSATQDGGVAHSYSLIDGWTASYPETTGYILATLIAYAQRTGNSDVLDRARRMLDWLVSIQFPDGGFQGGMVNQVPRVPVTFNTGQILIGLAAGAAIDSRYREPMRKAADWLVSTQDADGCWRRYPSPFAAAGEKTYDAHIILGLVAASVLEPARGYLEAALRQADWAISKQTPNGWFAGCCLSDANNPLTHTLGYALRGIVCAYQASGHERYLNAACRAADGLKSALGPDGRLAGRLNSGWQPAADWVCLTGSSQIAESWLLLHAAAAIGRPDYRDAARRANSFVRRTIAVAGPADMRGAVKGSFPIGGAYGRWKYLNWACKFTIDANWAELSIA